jgi:hypothetical protein
MKMRIEREGRLSGDPDSAEALMELETLKQSGWWEDSSRNPWQDRQFALPGFLATPPLKWRPASGEANCSTSGV